MAAAQLMPSIKPFKRCVGVEIQLRHFCLNVPQRASCWAPSGNNHKWQISCVSSSEAETRQEQENLHAQPLNWAQRKNISIPSGRKTHFLVQPGLLKWSSSSVGIKEKLLNNSFTHHEMINFSSIMQFCVQRKQSQEISSILCIQQPLTEDILKLHNSLCM